ncbi:MAG TPA: hypothetical protein VKU41_22930, partial [Polyangiaceae bacterium]|nr:hypothetical protein [Polyangiaceae bacterium]
VAAMACGTADHSGAGDGGAEGSFVFTVDATSDAGADAGSSSADDAGWGPLWGEAGASDVVEACTPVTACPTGVLCGRYVDPCGGQSFACGSPCPSGQVCASSGPGAQSCQPASCAGKCGVLGVDSCGVAIGCGGCPAGDDCVDNQCVARSTSPADAGVSDACAPLSCAPTAQMHLCGAVRDTCGHAMQCSCPSGQSCVGGVCAPPPPECDAGGVARCGSVTNACGSGTVACGGCAGSSKCVGGTCTSCSPPSCGAAKCGSVGNGCGAAISCGSCSGSEVCDDGGCCTPRTCGEALEAGAASGCGEVDLGCGVKKSCAPCVMGEVCVQSACAACTPKTCADFGGAGCGHSDGCGHTLDCCGAGTSCQGTICCLPGEVAYNGTCCLPGCDLDLPPGPQNSCGQVILCNGGGGSSGGSAGGSGAAAF